MHFSKSSNSTWFFTIPIIWVHHTVSEYQRRNSKNKKGLSLGYVGENPSNSPHKDKIMKKYFNHVADIAIFLFETGLLGTLYYKKTLSQYWPVIWERQMTNWWQASCLTTNTIDSFFPVFFSWDYITFKSYFYLRTKPVKKLLLKFLFFRLLFGELLNKFVNR